MGIGGIVNAASTNSGIGYLKRRQDKRAELAFVDKNGRFSKRAVGQVFKIDLVQKSENKVKYQHGTTANNVTTYAATKIGAKTGMSTTEAQQHLNYLKQERDSEGVSLYDKKLKAVKAARPDLIWGDHQTDADKDAVLKKIIIKEKDAIQKAMEQLEWPDYTYYAKSADPDGTGITPDGGAGNAYTNLGHCPPQVVGGVTKDGPAGNAKLIAKYLIVGVINENKIAVRVVGHGGTTAALANPWAMNNGALVKTDTELMTIDEFYMNWTLKQGVDGNGKAYNFSIYEGTNKDDIKLLRYKGIQKNTDSTAPTGDTAESDLASRLYSFAFANTSNIDAEGDQKDKDPVASNSIRLYAPKKTVDYGILKSLPNLGESDQDIKLDGALSSDLLGKGRSDLAITSSSYKVPIQDLVAELNKNKLVTTAPDNASKTQDKEIAFTRSTEGYISVKDYPNINNIERFPMLNFLQRALATFNNNATATAHANALKTANDANAEALKTANDANAEALKTANDATAAAKSAETKAVKATETEVAAKQAVTATLANVRKTSKEQLAASKVELDAALAMVAEKEKALENAQKIIATKNEKLEQRGSKIRSLRKGD